MWSDMQCHPVLLAPAGLFYHTDLLSTSLTEEICHTWVSGSTDVFEQSLITPPVRGSLSNQTNCHGCILLHHSHQKCQHEEHAGCGTSHLQSSCLGLHVLQWERHWTLTQRSCIASNNTAESIKTATSISSAGPTLDDNKREMLCFSITWLDRGCSCNGIPALHPPSPEEIL